MSKRKRAAKTQSSHVRVRVIARQSVRYDQILTFTRDDWAEFKRSDESLACEEIADRLDLRDVSDEGMLDFEATVVGDDGKPLKPLDSFGGES